METKVLHTASHPLTGVLLLNMGGPDCQGAVQPFLYNLFSDPDIFKFPLGRLTQKPLSWLVSMARQKSAREAYQKIGGGSPIAALTQAQADALQAHLKTVAPHQDFRVFIGMRYWHPYVDNALKRLKNEGVRRLIVLPLYPQFSLTTTGSSLRDLKQRLSEIDYSCLLETVYHFYDNLHYQSALAATIRQAIEETTWSCPHRDITILFSAHSLPELHVRQTGDIYPEQIAQTVQQIMERWFPEYPWQLCYQSKIGPIPWLRPYTEEALTGLSEAGCRNVLIVPVSFVSEHIETLYEIDQLYLPFARRRGITNSHRAPALNTHPLFIQALSNLVLEKANQFQEV